ncbi:MAG TPA: MFS transporter [Planctomycetota bacterium]|jgi:nucleoside transporter
MAGLSTNVRARLSVMMFLTYAFNGIWIIPLFNYLTKTVGYTDTQAAGMFSTTALGCIIAPFFVGMIADRFFSAEKVLAVLNFLSAIFLYLASTMAASADGKPQPEVMFWLLLAHFICYTPTWALTNTIALNQMSDPGRQFPAVRVMGAFGWIAVSSICLFSNQINAALGLSQPFEYTRLPMLIAVGIGVANGVFSFFLPSTPPKSTGHKPTIGDIIGVKALALFKDRNFCIFAVTTFLILLPNMFYWGFCNMYLNEIGMRSAQFKQSIGQMSEVFFTYLMPFFFIRYGVKAMLAMGFMAWLARFVCFAFGYQTASVAALLYLGIALHGVCWDFFFVTGQLYTDKKAPKAVQASAQGMLSMITFGLGWLVGANLAGMVISKHATHDLAASDILDRPALCAKIMEGKAATKPSPAQRVWETLDEGGRKAIEAGAAKDASGELDANVAKAITTVVMKPEFFNTAAFAGIVATATTDKDINYTNLVAKLEKSRKGELKGDEKLEDGDLRELNRSSIERAVNTNDGAVLACNRHQWNKIWLYPAGMAMVLFAFFLFGFHDKMLVIEKEAKDAAAPAEKVETTA